MNDEDGLEIDEDEAMARLRAIRFEESGGIYYNCTSKLEQRKIRVSDLQKFVDTEDMQYFEEEFEKLPNGLLKKYEVSQMKTNMQMNRYKGIYPYDDCRVKVQGGVTDYINASYIDEQYGYLHHALVHSLTFDCKPVAVDEFQQYMADTPEDTMVRMFQHLLSTIPQPTYEERAAIDRNRKLKEKNRHYADIPGDDYRPRLHLNMKPGTSDYINAVYVNSFKQKKKWIVAQTPLPETVNNFLALAMQENSSCIVSMDTYTETNKTLGVYFPVGNQLLKNGLFTVSCSEEERHVYMIKRSITIEHRGIQNQVKTIPLLHFTDWDINIPNSTRNFLLFIRDVESVTRQNKCGGPIFVHCLDAASKCGLVSVVATLIETMEEEQEISVSNVVRKVKARRKGAIPNQEQFQFCHDCVLEYIQSFDNYALLKKGEGGKTPLESIA